MVGGSQKSDTFSICACHPCAGAMLIFSVSFQFFRIPLRREVHWCWVGSGRAGGTGGCRPMNGSNPLSLHPKNNKNSSRSGNRTPGASVTGSNVTNYTNRDWSSVGTSLPETVVLKNPAACIKIRTQGARLSHTRPADRTNVSAVM
jgi:hypothetical protein